VIAPLTNEKTAFDAALDAKLLLRSTRAAMLATLAPPDVGPFASLVNMATAADAAPILLLSKLAAHTRHLDADPRMSLLLYSAFNRMNGGDPLTHARLTLVGRAERVSDADARQQLRARFLARHPKSNLYVDFADFAFFRVTIESAHLNGGFGRAANLAAERIVTSLTGAADLIAHEENLIADIAAQDPLIAKKLAALAGRSGGDWRLVGCDPEGIDIGDEEEIVRLPFENRVTTQDEARAVVFAMTEKVSLQ
jgi:putative heme iron utilization protein